MNAVTSPHAPFLAPLAAQDEAIDHYLAGLLAEADEPLSAPTPSRAPIPFVRAELFAAEPPLDEADWVDESAPALAECAPMDYAVAASAWSDPLALDPLALDPLALDPLALEMPEPSPATPSLDLPSPAQQPELQAAEPLLIPPELFQEPAPADRVAFAEFPPEVSPKTQPDIQADIQPDIQPDIHPRIEADTHTEPASSVPPAWQFFQMGALTVALPSTEIQAVLTAPSLKPVQGAPAAFAGAVQHQARWLPVVSLAGFLPQPTGMPVVALLGAQGLWGVALGAATDAPETAVWDAVHWRSEADTATDRPWLLGIQPAARLVVLNAPALRRLLDHN